MTHEIATYSYRIFERKNGFRCWSFISLIPYWMSSPLSLFPLRFPPEKLTVIFEYSFSFLPVKEKKLQNKELLHLLSGTFENFLNCWYHNALNAGMISPIGRSIKNWRGSQKAKFICYTNQSALLFSSSWSIKIHFDGGEFMKTIAKMAHRARHDFKKRLKTHQK